MQYDTDPSYAIPAAEAPADARAAFIARTYGHVLGAIAALVLGCTVVLQSGLAKQMAAVIPGFAYMIGFFIIAWIAERLAFSLKSRATQYAGLGLYVLAEALFLSPLLFWASELPQFDGVIMQAVIATGAIFCALTYVAFTSKKDFSFLRGIVCVGGFVLIGLFIAMMIFGWSIFLPICFGFLALTAGMILYQTQDVLHRYPTDMHVGAALTLFASIATLFFYLLQILMSFASDD